MTREEINLPFFRQLAFIVEEIFQAKEETLQHKTPLQKRSELFAECRRVKEELEALQDALSREEYIIKAFTEPEDRSSHKYLKSIWKEACKLCHPDVVRDMYKVKAGETMQLLNEYYSSGNIRAVENLLSTLNHERV